VQSNLGYNDLYDWISPAADMSIASNTTEFTYNHISWRIELWKGAYLDTPWGLGSAGAEIGIYSSQNANSFQYDCSTNKRLGMSYTLASHGDTLFSRSSKHNGATVAWWLTGFRPCDMTQKGNLTMEDIEIDFGDKNFASAFVKASSLNWKQNGSLVTLSHW
jgi:hypothetical protein